MKRTVVLLTLFSIFILITPVAALLAPNLIIGLSKAAGPQGLMDPDGSSKINISGSAFNLSVSLFKDGVYGEHISNVSLMWFSINESVVKANITLSNTTANQSEFGILFDTKSIPDGLYNLIITIYNFSEEGPDTSITNDTVAQGITIDNTAPVISSFLLSNVTNHANLSAGLSYDAFPLIAQVTDALTFVTAVTFEITPPNSTNFNATPLFNDGKWTALLNLSLLAEGTHIVRLYAQDILHNLNNTQSLLFVIDRTKPTAQASCSPSSVILGLNVTCTCSGSDSLSGVQQKSFSSGVASEPINSTTTGTFNSTTCTVIDYAGNMQKAMGTWEVTPAVNTTNSSSSSSDSSSSSSSSSGGSSSSSSSSSSPSSSSQSSSTADSEDSSTTTSSESETVPEEEPASEEETELSTAEEAVPVEITPQKPFSLRALLSKWFDGFSLTGASVKQVSTYDGQLNTGTFLFIATLLAIIASLVAFMYLGQK